jgi:hypothetical protein
MPTTNDPIIIDCPECCPEGIILVDRCDWVATAFADGTVSRPGPLDDSPEWSGK